MKRAIAAIAQATLLLAFALSTTAFGVEALPVITARMATAALPQNPLDPAWLKLPPATIKLYPQTSVSPAAAPGRTLKLSLRAVHDAKALLLHLEWSDPRPAKARGIGAFADSVAVQWPARYGPGASLPYVGMGHSGSPVALWFWRADGKTETLAAEGFSTLSTQRTDGVQAEGLWRDGRWRVVFRRALAAPEGSLHARLDPEVPIPLALAVWDGNADERDGAKRLSAWHELRFEGAGSERAEPPLMSERRGDFRSGKRLMTAKACVACHSFPGNPARPSVGPDLTYAGGIHSIGYLLESLAEPSKIIVPGKGFSAMVEGKRVSLMPPFDGSEQERRDIVAFLRSLK